MTVPEILRSEPDMSGSLEPFRERLAETVSWCVRRSGTVPLGDALRSPGLAPPTAASWPDTVRAVATARLHALGRSWRRTIDPLGGGLLLVHFPTPPHSHGAARAASDGYFDLRDAPPWDSWAAYIEEAERSYLVAWVPPEALAQASAGITVAGTSLGWLTSAGLGLSGFGP